ncbi:cytochrome c oxidase subunit 3 [Williamsia sp.]|uniref:cytochrome c oxidase subunit 3 n=1 Tax=Williamsia sp. TaxID=1872085 RepID=UPI002F9460FD
MNTPVGRETLAVKVADSDPGVDTAENDRSIPGGWEIWLFVLGEMTIFVVMFATYAYSRSDNPDAFAAAQEHVHKGFGAINTLVLLTSSLFVVLALTAVRFGERGVAYRLLYAAMGCGVLFMVIKSIEWTIEIRAGLTFGSSAFGSYYYMMCALHLGHVVVGLIALFAIVTHLRRRPEPNWQLVDSAAIYWHMVDLLWIILFPLLYLVR